MITPIESVDELNKLLRIELMKQSELDATKVLNALSLHGNDMSKYLSDSIYKSLEVSDTILFFELQSRSDIKDVSMSESDGSITYYKPFRMHCIMYGLKSSTTMAKLVARLRTELSRNSLYDKGVYLEKISDPLIFNEYINETMWLRNDIDVDIAVNINVEPVEDEQAFVELDGLNIFEIRPDIGGRVGTLEEEVKRLQQKYDGLKVVSDDDNGTVEIKLNNKE